METARTNWWEFPHRGIRTNVEQTLGLEERTNPNESESQNHSQGSKWKG